MTFRHTSEMGTIGSLSGSSYEAYCQDMLEVGVHWLLEHPHADLRIKQFSNVFGLAISSSDDMEELERVILKAANNQASSAMFQAVVNRLLYIANHGWDTYVAECSKPRSTD